LKKEKEKGIIICILLYTKHNNGTF